jgi:hypothetical protein
MKATRDFFQVKPTMKLYVLLAKELEEISLALYTLMMVETWSPPEGIRHGTVTVINTMDG